MSIGPIPPLTMTEPSVPADQKLDLNSPITSQATGESINNDATSTDAATQADADKASANAQKAADGVSSCCKGGGCGGAGEITGQCSKYQSECNASCQKAMAPYSDSCSSCGGSGAEGGGSGGGGGGGSSSSDSGGSSVFYEAARYELTFIYDPAIVDFAASSITTNPNGTITAVAFTSTGLFRFNNTNMELVTKLYISETDSTGDAVAPIFDVLNANDTLVFTKNDNEEVFVFMRYVSQVDNGNNRTITVEYISHLGAFASGNTAVMDCSRNIIKIPAGATVVTACPDCGGTGLEGSGGGLDGVIMAVYNGSAGFAGVENIDIYGIVQPS